MRFLRPGTGRIAARGHRRPLAGGRTIRMIRHRDRTTASATGWRGDDAAHHVACDRNKANRWPTRGAAARPY